MGREDPVKKKRTVFAFVPADHAHCFFFLIFQSHRSCLRVGLCKKQNKPANACSLKARGSENRCFSLSRPLSTWVYSIQKLLELQYLFVSIQLVYIRWSIHVYQRGFMENLAYPVYRLYRANNASLFESVQREGVVLHYTGSIDAIVT
jgi:hypothetical protein